MKVGGGEREGERRKTNAKRRQDVKNIRDKT
jgi:hypothetical protein